MRAPARGRRRNPLHRRDAAAVVVVAALSAVVVWLLMGGGPSSPATDGRDPQVPVDARDTGPARVRVPAVAPVAVAVRPPAPTPPTMPAATAPAPTRQVASEGQIVVTTMPAGARVSVSGVAWGETPLTIRHLPLGTKTIRVTRDGYLGQERTVRITGDQPAARVHMALRRAGGR